VLQEKEVEDPNGLVYSTGCMVRKHSSTDVFSLQPRNCLAHDVRLAVCSIPGQHRVVLAGSSSDSFHFYFDLIFRYSRFNNHGYVIWNQMRDLLKDRIAARSGGRACSGC